MKHLFQINKKRAVPILSLILIVGLVLVFLANAIRPARAAWFDDSWAFRNLVPITAHTAAETNVYIAVTINSTSNFQADCGDLRWTDAAGKILRYFVVSGCGGASTVVDVWLDSFPAGAQDFYYYYGNPGAANGFAAGDFTPQAASYTVGTIGAQEKATAPVAYWKFDDGTGTTAKDGSINNNLGTLTGSTLPTWQTEDLCVSGKCLYFNGITSNVTGAATANGVQTVSFWVKPATSSASLVQLASGKDVLATSGTVSTNGFTSPTIYVNGSQNTSITANQWNLVTVTTGTAITADSIVLGKMQNGVLNGFLDDVKFYNYARSAAQIKLDYNTKSAGSGEGGSGVFGAQTTDALNQGLVGYWKMDDNVSGNAKTITDSSGNGNNGSTVDGANDAGMDCTIPGKFGRGCHFDATDDDITVANTLAGVQTVAFWASPSATTINILDLNGTATVTASSGTISANNFTSPTIYIDGQTSGTLVANTWKHVVITTSTAISASAITLGLASGSYYGGRLDEVRMYNRALSPAEVSQLYNFAPGPVGYWNFEEAQGTSAADISGQANTGTWAGAGTHWVAGKYGRAGQFDGATDSVNAGSAAVLDNLANFTAQAWIYPRSLGEADAGIILSKENGGDSEGWNFYYGTTGGINTVCLNISRATQDLISCKGTNVPLNSWYHVAVVYDNSLISSNILFYLNGVLFSHQSDQNGSGAREDDASKSFFIGNEPSAGQTFDGYIDEAKIYNYARTSKQIIEDMNAGHPSGGSPVGSSANYWKLDEGTLTTANDSGYQKTTGTLTNLASPPSVGIHGWNIHGKFGKAVSFNGADGYIDFGDLAHTESVGTMSASFWVNPNSLATQICLLCKWQNTAAAGKESWAIETGSSNSNAILVEISTDGNASQATAETPAGMLAVGTWTHVLVVYDSNQTGNANVLKIYINGIKQQLTFTGTVPSNTQATTSNLRAGASSDASPVRNFSGTLDEIKIYLAALSDQEVKVDYNRSQGVQFGSLGVSSADAKTASNSAATTYCVPGDTTSCAPPVGEWHMEQGQGTSVNDSSGNDKTASILTATTSNRWAAGKFGKSINFEGAANNATVVSTNSTYVTPTQISVEAWIYPRGLGFLGIGTIFWLGPDSADGSFRFRVGANNTLNIQVLWSVGSNGADQRTLNNSIVLNSWQHVTLTYDSSTATNRPAIYLNGVRQQTQTDTSNAGGTFSTTASTWAFGNRTGRNLGFNGFIDAVRVFDYIRTPEQIAWDFNRGLPTTWWKFDDCQGTTARDSVSTVSGTLNSGTPGSCLTASTAWGNGVTGKNNYSLAFGSAPNLTTVTSTNTYPFSNVATASATTASWGGWFKPTSSVNSQAFVDKANQFRLYTNSSGHTICGVYNTGAYQDASSVTAPITLNSWNHAICTYDGTNIKTYVNGFLMNTTANANNISVATSNLYVGQLSDASNQFTGQADDIKIWNYALTAYQVRVDYNSNAAIRFGPTTGSP